MQVLAKDSDRVNRRFSEAESKGMRVQDRRVSCCNPQHTVLHCHCSANWTVDIALQLHWELYIALHCALYIALRLHCALYIALQLHCTVFIALKLHCARQLQVSCEEIVTHLCNCGPVIVLTNANLLVCRYDS